MKVQYRAGKQGWYNGKVIVHSPVGWTDIPVEAPDGDTGIRNAFRYFNLTKINYEVRVVDDMLGLVAQDEINPNPFYDDREVGWARFWW